MKIFRASYKYKMIDGAVVVLYNPIGEELKNILNYANKVTYTYIVDNSINSHWKDINSLVEIDDDKVIYNHFPQNIGLCKGMNVAMYELKKRGCKWAFTMNSDSYFKNDVITIFRNYILEHNCKDVAMLVPIYNYDRHFAKTYMGYKNKKRAMMSGSYMNLEVFVEMSGFLEILFVDGLDNEYCIRCRKKDYKIIECGMAIMEHMPCQTKSITIFSKKIMYGYDLPKRYYGHARSLIFIVKRYGSIYELMFYFYKLFKIIFLFDNKKAYYTNFIQGTKDGIEAEKNSRTEVRI